MEFLTLGPFQALHNGTQMDLGVHQQQLALAVLLLHANRPISPERMTDIMWPVNKPQSNLITGYIAGLRKILKESHVTDVVIDTTPTGYVLRINEEQLDSTRFVKLYDQATSAGARGDRALARKLLREAFELWRGRHFDDLDIDRIGGVEVVLLDEAYLDCLGDLAELELAAGNHRWVRDKLRPVVNANPSRQRHVALLMRALIANGNQVDAVKVYHEFLDELDELDITPVNDVRNLAWLATHGETRGVLPRRPIRFTGRADELASIESIAAASTAEAQTIWLSGSPGVGKTGLAVEAAWRLSKEFPDARLFIELNGFTPGSVPTSAEDALAEALLQLGVPAEQIPPEPDRRRSLYQARLLDTRTLIVLDNAESETQMLSLLPDEPGCLAIVTSRKDSGHAATERIRLKPLPHEDARELFRRLTNPARASGRSAQLTEVVDRCGRLPLYIRVMASQFSRHDAWPLDHLVELLNEPAPWPSDSDGTVACLVSYRHLDYAQGIAFRLLGRLPGRDIGVPGAAALAGCDRATARSLLDGLHEACLLEEIAPERYQMLDPIKEFAGSIPQPATQNEATEALERLLDFYVLSVSRAIRTAYPFDGDNPPKVDHIRAAAMEFDHEGAAMGWLSAEQPNLLAAIKYAERHLPDHAWRLAVLLWRYFSTTGKLLDWVQTLELAKKIVMADPANRHGQAHVLLRIAAAYRRSGQLMHAQELAAQALSRWVALGDILGEANALCALANAKMELGDNDEAVADFEAALARYEEIGDIRGQAQVLSLLGYLNEQRGRFRLALDQHLAAVPMLRGSELRPLLAHALDNLGTVQQRLDLLDEAMASHEEALQLGTKAIDLAVQAYALNNIGNVHRLRGQLEEALRYHEDARKVADAVPDAHLRTQLSFDRATTFQACDDLPAALAGYQAALDLAASARVRRQQALAHRGIAEVLHTMGKHENAADHWSAAETEFDLLRQPEASEVRNLRRTLRCLCADDQRGNFNA